MARSMWSGAISFGLVSIPVRLYAATSSKTVRFHQIDAETGSRVRQQRVLETDGSEVPYERIVKGYELSSGQHVIITDEEMAALDPKASRTIDLLEFVDQSSINPLYYESAYYLGPDPATVKPYALLLQAMTESDKVGVARFVMRGKEHLCAIRPDDGVLVLSTMRYADEVRESEEITELDAVAEAEVSDAEVAMAGQLIASLDAAFDPERYRDTYRDKVLELIEAKQRGDELTETPQPVEAATVVDLMAALQASVAEAKQARGRHPSAHEAEELSSEAKSARDEPAADVASEQPEHEEPAEPDKKAARRKAPAKKAAARKTPAKARPAKKATARKAAPAERRTA